MIICFTASLRPRIGAPSRRNPVSLAHLMTDQPGKLFGPDTGRTAASNRRTSRNARTVLAGVVFADAAEHWDINGPGVLRRLAFHDPAAYVAFIAKLVPQKLEIERHTPLDDVNEELLAVSLRLSKAIAFLPPEDRELLDMLLSKGELLASQKKLQGEKDFEGGGGQSDENFSAVKGTPLPLYADPPNPFSAGPAGAAGAVRENASSADAGGAAPRGRVDIIAPAR